MTHLQAGFRARHFGEVLYTQVKKNEFEAVVDKCQVTVYTDPAECTRIRHEVAIPTFDKRDARLETLTDESVDVYYSCILCQAFFSVTCLRSNTGETWTLRSRFMA